MIVAVSGGKGGVGKSTIALNLGRELDAVVVDGDLTTADLPRGHGPNLHDVLAGRADPLEAIDRRDAVRVLPCGRTLAGARAVDLTAFARVIDRIEREFGRVLVDCPAGLARDVGQQLACAQLTVLVTTPTEPALTDALRTKRLALDLETPVAAVVLNRADTAAIDRIGDRVERYFGAPAIGLEELPAVADAQAHRRPVRDVHPDCSAVDAVQTVAQRIERCEKRLTDRIGVR
ncbi:chromosome partitioning protein ParA [Natrinema sp. CBA1119]|uniref:MinD/ParA family ATP-binding protein n=1 Tax=Natrinema sp. CBA1119 TaxID=1608465 RepID=UPI000BF4FBF1|nr:P-loop NTPase [Natrinema sp. CBA1119]PGF16723.1 chromosome partitioning protein ParA [Natrinema sp. CBA1119]